MAKASAKPAAKAKPAGELNSVVANQAPPPDDQIVGGVRLLSRATRDFIGEYDGVRYQVAAGQFTTVPKPFADHLLENYSNEIVAAGAAVSEVLNANQKAADAEAALAAANQRIAELEEQLTKPSDPKPKSDLV